MKVASLLVALAISSAGCKRPIETVEPAPMRSVDSLGTWTDDASVVALPPDAGPPTTYLRGSTHVHTVHSGDSKMSPENVARWYQDHDYDFIVITDHNRVTDFSFDGELLVLRGVELTNNPPACEPPPLEPEGKCRVHVNSLFVTKFEGYVDGTRPPKIEWREKNSIQRVDLYQAAIAKSRALGGVAQLNHSTWHWGTDGKLLAELGRRGMVLFEVANTAFASWNEGDGSNPGTEAIWDAALSAGQLIYGVASDDAHHYRESVLERRKANGKSLYPAGGGWVMVRAHKTPESIQAGLLRGDFYASTGVVLSSAGRVGGSYEVVVADNSKGTHKISLIGSGGRTLETIEGRSARFDLGGLSGYVRVVVRSSRGGRAWTQPLMLSRN